MSYVGLANREYFRKKVRKPLLEAGKLEMTRLISNQLKYEELLQEVSKQSMDDEDMEKGENVH